MEVERNRAFFFGRLANSSSSSVVPEEPVFISNVTCESRAYIPEEFVSENASSAERLVEEELLEEEEEVVEEGIFTVFEAGIRLNFAGLLLELLEYWMFKAFRGFKYVGFFGMEKDEENFKVGEVGPDL